MFEKAPNLKGILDHIGKPLIAQRIFEPWEQLISEISEIPNLYCKISGMITEATKKWKNSDFDGYVDHILKQFGEDRVMFGSDWPVCLMAGTYIQVFDLLQNILIEHFSEKGRIKFLSENAKTFYSLG